MSQPRIHAQLFIVMGDSGSVGEFDPWPVAAYHDKAMAEAHAAKLNEWANEARARFNETQSLPLVADNPYETMRMKHPFDQMQDGNGQPEPYYGDNPYWVEDGHIPYFDRLQLDELRAYNRELMGKGEPL